MENAKGYVYVMINPSCEGLVKIGKTTKDPEERAKELSSATGVATPFVVVYKRLFNDCSIAETLIHRLLEERGCRVNKSREFFSIDISEAIDVILNIPDNSIPSEEVCIEATDADSDENLADTYYNKADNYYYGADDVFEDEDLALEYFEKSASLGKAAAYLKIGEIWSKRGRMRQAINAYKMGVDNGYLLCYGKLGQIFNNQNSGFYNKRNAELAYKKFFEFVDNSEGLHLNIDVAWEHMGIGFIVHDFIFEGVLNDDISLANEEFLIKYTSQIQTHFEQYLIYLQELNPEAAYFVESKMRPYINKLVEKYEVYGLDGIELAKKYFLLAKESFKYIEKFDNSSNYLEEEQKAFELFTKSLELGYQISNVYIGICWLYRGYDYSIANADKAWREFYNKAYDSLQTLDDQTRSMFLDGFIELFSAAIEFNRVDLLHPYYAYLSMYMGIVEHYTARIDKLNEMLDIDVVDLNVDNLSEEDIVRLRDAIAAKEEIEKLQRVHNYIETIVAQIQSSNNSQAKFRKLT
ncbi:MAG: GIY-YIG nuclease family protein [Alistipes sp.]|nr:GIY-YIG nuclease family protein [Alistipes sp.]